VLKFALGVGLILPFVECAAAEETDVKNARPREGDRFVFAAGDRQGQVITPSALSVGGPPVIAYPVDPATGLVRDGSRLNEVLVIRLDAADLTAETFSSAADGIVAYSAICTHAGCEVSAWRGEEKILHCPCHDSLFDPKDGARVVGGPARRRLSRLPLKIVNGELVAAAGFSGRVGFQPG
jgi:Rieske Fe-S protein